MDRRDSDGTQGKEGQEGNKKDTGSMTLAAPSNSSKGGANSEAAQKFGFSSVTQPVSTEFMKILWEAKSGPEVRVIMFKAALAMLV
jgi:hypothetical protein